jgi:hypothetical protein
MQLVHLLVLVPATVSTVTCDTESLCQLIDRGKTKPELQHAPAVEQMWQLWYRATTPGWQRLLLVV